MMLGQREYSQAFGHGVFQPCRETGSGVTVAGDELVERDLGLGERDCIPDAAQLGTDALADGGVGSVVDGVGGEVELAALPGSGTKHGPTGGTQARVVVGDDEPDAAHAARDQAIEKATPVDLGLRQGDADAEHPAPLVRAMPIADRTAASRTTPPARIFS